MFQRDRRGLILRNSCLLTKEQKAEVTKRAKAGGMFE